MIKKQMRIILICVAAFAVLTVCYFVVLEPMLAGDGETEAEDIELLDGETIGQSNRIMITPKAERADIKNIVVKNKIDEYKMIHHLGYDQWYIEGAEFVTVNPELLASFVTNVGYLLSMVRVAAKDIDDGNELLEDLEQFGFNPDNSYFTVTRKDDSYYKIIIGDKIPTSGGYYVMYEDNDGLRPAIYIIDTMLEGTIMAHHHDLLVAYIAPPIENQMDYMYIDNFRLYKGSELFVELYQAEIPEGSEMIVNHQMRYPTAYTPDATNYDNILRTFVGFVGDAVVATDITDETLKEFGFDQYAYRLSYEFQEKEYQFLISSLTENNTYYITAADFNAIVEISADKLPFLTWDIIKYVDKPIFGQNIMSVKEIKIVTPENTTVFPLEHFVNDDGKQDINIIVNGKRIDTARFRQYYISLLSIDLWDYEEPVTDAEPMAEMIVTLINGEVLHYKFYFSSTRRCYYTINDVGEFYVLRERVLKMISDTNLIAQDLPVNADIVDY